MYCAAGSRLCCMILLCEPLSFSDLHQRYSKKEDVAANAQKLHIWDWGQKTVSTVGWTALWWSILSGLLSHKCIMCVLKFRRKLVMIVVIYRQVWSIILNLPESSTDVFQCFIVRWWWLSFSTWSESNSSHVLVIIVLPREEGMHWGSREGENAWGLLSLRSASGRWACVPGFLLPGPACFSQKIQTSFTLINRKY